MVKPEKLCYRKPHFAMRATCVGIHSNNFQKITFRLERRPLDLHWRSNFLRDLGANSGAIESCWIKDTMRRLTRISYNFGYFCGIIEGSKSAINLSMLAILLKSSTKNEVNAI
jgi:hypothetical protein